MKNKKPIELATKVLYILHLNREKIKQTSPEFRSKMIAVELKIPEEIQNKVQNIYESNRDDVELLLNILKSVEVKL